MIGLGPGFPSETQMVRSFAVPAKSARPRSSRRLVSPLQRRLRRQGGSGSLEHCTEICPPVQFFFQKKLNYRKSGGIFVKLVDCGGYLVNLASTEYWSITEKFKDFFIKLMDFIIILTKSRVFFTKFTEYYTITKSSGFFLK